MKKFIFFTILLIGLVSCENELDLIEEWKDIPIVYGIIDPADTAHYIRIEKAFIDAELSGVELAQTPDSIYYDVLDVDLIKGLGNNATRVSLEKVDGNLEGYIREEGSFAQSPNYLYKVLSSDIDLKGGEELQLEIFRPNVSEAITSNIKTIGYYEFIRPRLEDPERINLSYASYITMRWELADFAEDYEVFITFHYSEKNEGEPFSSFEPKQAVWKVASNVNDNNIIIKAKDLATFIGSAIKEVEGKERRFDSVQYTIVAVGKELSDYIAIGGANLGITASQEIPKYSNISEGLGIFSSRRQIDFEGLEFNTASMDTLLNGIYTKHINFLF